MAAKMRIAIAAGEALGDQLGAGLIRSALAVQPDLEFVGIAGPAMRAAGCVPWYRVEDLSVMGLAEVLRHLRRLLRIRHGFTGRVRDERPAAFVGIDAPDFNLRVAADLRAAGIPTVQYVCPSIWAWRQGRVRALRRACDHVLCLLPFEVPLLERSGVPASFVGHPFADEIPGCPPRDPARRALGLDAGTVIGLLPGSRASEVGLLGPVFLQAARQLAQEGLEPAFVAAMASPDLRSQFRAQAAVHAPGLDLTLVDGRAREVMAASDVVLMASGTATLEGMLVGRPMVVAYRFAPLTYWLAKSLKLVKVKYFSLPNLLADEALVPEFLQHEVTATALADAVRVLLQSPERQQVLQQRFAELGQVLRRGASDAAARVVLEMARLG